ncbi:hypothetical protein SAMN05444414_101369 [Roseovarius marisflavi]|uniref:Uncharacterized protein n=1 Tax=Roseovarius marisflavi TaxID=1054996 RepID=A0A1M6VKR0_9RHOB|nr:hypothetical protein SAMN05444414_101369 [Roseovarius marisflavi]
MTRFLPQRLPAVQGPTAGGRSDGFVGRFMVPNTVTTVCFCAVAKAPARGAVGRCTAARRRALIPRKGVTEARVA